MSDPTADLSVLLLRCSEGDKTAEQELFEKTYDELKRIARVAFQGEKKDSSLQPTLLINEAFFRMPKAGTITWQNRHHFFAIAARAMRRALIDHAREVAAQKRPQKNNRETDDFDLPGGFVDPATVLTIHAALDAFEVVDPRRAQTVELHYFGGMSYGEIAELTGRNEDAVKKDWRVARLWLLKYMRGSGPEE